MRKITLAALGAVLLFSCNKEINGYLIEGTADAVADGTMAYIEISDDKGGVKAIDSVAVQNGKFEFKGDTKTIDIAYIQVGELQGKVPFILENGKIGITIYKDSLGVSKIGGTYNNDEFSKFNEEFEKFQKKMMKFQTDNVEAYKAAQEANDTEKMTQIQNDYAALEKTFTDYTVEYTTKNTNSFVSLMLLTQMVNNPEIDLEQTKKSLEALSDELKNNKMGKEALEKIKALSSTSVGQIAPDFSALNPDGKMVSLKESLGKVTLIDFWASWCGPCRRENPNVVALYNEFHDKGFNIIGVSLDREGQKEEWLKAIEADKLTWVHISNLKFWNDPIAKQYNIQAIPATFLLDSEGKIVAKNLRGAELRAKVAEMLKD